MLEIIISLFLGVGTALAMWFGWGLGTNIRELRRRNAERRAAELAAEEAHEPEPTETESPEV